MYCIYGRTKRGELGYALLFLEMVIEKMIEKMGNASGADL